MKVFVYVLVIEDLGLERVLEKIGVEFLGDVFNEFLLERGINWFMNLMINVGVIIVYFLVVGLNVIVEEWMDCILKVFFKFVG